MLICSYIMNQHIKISKQSTKILGNYAKHKIFKSHSNYMLPHTRFVPNSIFKKITLPDNTKTHANTTKIDLLDFLRF